MRAVVWHGPRDMRVERVPDPGLLRRRDAILRITSTAICGTDLHLYNGFAVGMRSGDIVGHEFMGEVVDVGPDVKNIRKGDRVVASCMVSCGSCFFCQHGMHSACDNSNPNAALAEPIMGYSPAGIIAYTHLFGGYAGGQAEYVRVPYADVGLFKVPEGLSDEKVLFLSDILPTAWMAAENAQIEPGDTVAVWGCGPVGLLAMKCAELQGAERIIAIDRVPERLMLAAEACGAEPINFEERDPYTTLRDWTGGRGPDCCIDAVGMEAHGLGLVGFYDRVKQGAMLESDRPHVLREMIKCVRKVGRISVAGAYGGLVDKFPMGVVFGKSLTIKAGAVNVQHHAPKLLEKIVDGVIDPTFIITHRLPLGEAPEAYAAFNDKHDGCIKVVMDPWSAGPGSDAEGSEARATDGAQSSRIFNREYAHGHER